MTDSEILMHIMEKRRMMRHFKGSTRKVWLMLGVIKLEDRSSGDLTIEISFCWSHMDCDFHRITKSISLPQKSPRTPHLPLLQTLWCLEKFSPYCWWASFSFIPQHCCKIAWVEHLVREKNNLYERYISKVSDHISFYACSVWFYAITKRNLHATEESGYKFSFCLKRGNLFPLHF